MSQKTETYETGPNGVLTSNGLGVALNKWAREHGHKDFGEMAQYEILTVAVIAQHQADIQKVEAIEKTYASIPEEDPKLRRGWWNGFERCRTMALEALGKGKK